MYVWIRFTAHVCGCYVLVIFDLRFLIFVLIPAFIRFKQKTGLVAGLLKHVTIFPLFVFCT